MYPNRLPPGLTGMAMATRWWRQRYLGSPSGPVRVAATLIVLVPVLIAVAALGWACRFPPGYAGAQSARAATLAGKTHEELQSLDDGGFRDLTLFIPGLTLIMAAVLILASPPRRPPAGNPGPPTGVTGWTWISFALLALYATADVIETALFRSTLAQLLKGVEAATLDGRTLLTAAFTCLKWFGIIAVAVVFVVRVCVHGHRTWADTA